MQRQLPVQPLAVPQDATMSSSTTTGNTHVLIRFAYLMHQRTSVSLLLGLISFPSLPSNVKLATTVVLLEINDDLPSKRWPHKQTDGLFCASQCFSHLLCVLIVSPSGGPFFLGWVLLNIQPQAPVHSEKSFQWISPLLPNGPLDLWT